MPSSFRSNHQGFTLIEVLIASVILFLFLALASEAFSQSALSSRKAERAAKVAAMVPLMIENIRVQIIEAKQVSDLGSEGVLFELNYAWRAKLLQRLKPPRRFDPDENEFKEYDERFNLWQVDITVSEGTYQRSWQYEEISWHK